MRPVNLLPEGDRPRRTDQGGGGANVALGVLGALLIAVLALVLTQNQINTRKSEAIEADRAAQSAEKRATDLAAFGSFASIKQTRVQSVTQLASARFDWERFMRELALVLPGGTTLLQAAGSTSGSTSGAAGGTTATPDPATDPTAGSPTVELTGCAKSQPRVAVMMVRLRRMYRVTDVTLSDSTRPEAEDGAGASAATDSGSGEGDNSDCAPDQFKFIATATFAPEATPQPKPRKVPSALGGGA